MQMFQHKHMGWDTLQSTSIFYIKFVKLNRVKSKATNLRKTKKSNIVKKKTREIIECKSKNYYKFSLTNFNRIIGMELYSVYADP